MTALAVPDASVDAVGARWIFMLLPEPGQGLFEARRVLRPGGRLVFAVFGTGERNPFFTLAAGVLAERGLVKLPGPGEPSMFALADTASTASLIESAGFAGSSVSEVALSYRLADSDDLWSLLSEFAGPISMALGKQDDATRAELRAEIERRAEAHRDGAGYALPGLALVYTANA